MGCLRDNAGGTLSGCFDHSIVEAHAAQRTSNLVRPRVVLRVVDHGTLTMRRHILLAAIIVALAPGCASVSTRLALLDPAHSYAPASHTDILWQEPPRRFVVIASMDSTAAAGSSDAALFEHAKAEAGAIGADAIIVLETGWRPAGAGPGPAAPVA